MGLVIGIAIAILTLPIAFGTLMSGSNWETGQGGNPTGAVVTLAIGWTIAGVIIYSHYHPIHLSW